MISLVVRSTIDVIFWPAETLWPKNEATWRPSSTDSHLFTMSSLAHEICLRLVALVSDREQYDLDSMPRRIWDVRFSAIVNYMLQVPHGDVTAQHVQGRMFVRNPTWSADQLSRMAPENLKQLSLMVEYAIAEVASTELLVDRYVHLITSSIRLVQICQTKGEAAAQAVIDRAKAGTWPIHFQMTHGQQDVSDLFPQNTVEQSDPVKLRSGRGSTMSDCSMDIAMSYLRGLGLTANAPGPEQLRAQWILHAILSDSAIKSALPGEISDLWCLDLFQYERIIRTVAGNSPQWRAVIAYAMSPPSEEQIRANRLSRYAYAVLDCCQLWQSEVTLDAMQESLRDPHLMRSQLLATTGDRWMSLPMPEYRMSNKTVVPMQWMLRVIDQSTNPVAYVRATDIEHGLVVKQLVHLIQCQKPIMKDIQLHTCRDEHYLTAADAMLAVSRKNKRSSSKFSKWVMQHAGQYCQASDIEFVHRAEPKIPCIYLIRIATVAELRDHLGIPSKHADTSSVFKYGKTKNYKARKGQHDNLWSTQCGVWPQTVVIKETDTDQLTTKEKEIRDRFTSSNRCLVHTTYQELVVLSDAQLAQAEEWLDRL